MIRLQPKDRIALVSLSAGLLGEPDCSHLLEWGLKRLKELDLEPVLMPHALKGVEYLKNHPEKRAEDLLTAFADRSVAGILCAIGGNDTYRTAPYILTPEGKSIIKTHPKFFVGYSDSTVNHLMLYQLGVPSFYGMAFMTDFAEKKALLPYTEETFRHLFTTEEFIYRASPYWYEERKAFTREAVAVPRKCHKEKHGYEFLNGAAPFQGKLFGGCISSLWKLIKGEAVKTNKVYQLLPQDFSEKMIIFLETSEEKPAPAALETMLKDLKAYGLFRQAAGILVGKPQDEVYYEAYKAVYQEIFPHVPVLYNMNFGHAYPKILLQYGALATVDGNRGEIHIRRL